jgi:hypothetical protein
MSHNLEEFREAWLTEARKRLIDTDPAMASPAQLVYASALLKQYDFVDQYLGLTPERTAMILAMSAEDFAAWIEVPRNQFALVETLSDPIAVEIIFRDETATGAITGNMTAMTVLAASSEAMTTLAASSTAVSILTESDTAMTAIAASVTAMDPFIVWALHAFAESGTAMTAVAASDVAMACIVNNNTAMQKITGTAIALNRIVKSDIARTWFAGSSSLQGYANKVRATLVADNNTQPGLLFTLKDSNAAQTSAYYGRYGVIGYNGSNYATGLSSSKTAFSAGPLLVCVTTMGLSSGTTTANYNASVYHRQTESLAGSVPLDKSYTAQGVEILCVGGSILETPNTSSQAGMKYYAFEAK